MGRTFHNPVLSGSYPDPSICRTGDDYWMVNSSFEFFPALPVHHSRDLVHWHCVGNVIDRPECIDLGGVERWSGVWAPTIRHHGGVFYVVWTDVRGVMSQTGARPRSYIATATDPVGPWCDPVVLNDPAGFDPSLYFEPDGGAWYGATYIGGCGRSGHFLRRLDTRALQLVGEERVVWSGDGEGTHVYRIDGRYYMLAAAGGTGQGHCVVVARSEDLLGPYVENRFNPILTHRHLGQAYPISATGHGDLVQTRDGNWWMVLLAKRGHGQSRDVLGRETFLVPVTWEMGWPVMNAGRGLVEAVMPAPALAPHPWPEEPVREDFDCQALGPQWCYLRTPRLEWYDLRSRRGFLRLRCAEPTLSGTASPAFRCRRLKHQDYAIAAAMEFAPASARSRAGLVLYASERSHFQFAIALAGERLQAQVWQRDRDDTTETLLGSAAVGGRRFVLSAEAVADRLTFAVDVDGGPGAKTVAVGDARLLSDDRSWTSNGAWYGLYACGAGDGHADFDWLDYRPA